MSDKLTENVKTTCHNSLPSIDNMMNYSSENFYQHETPMLIKQDNPKASIPFKIEKGNGLQPSLLESEQPNVKGLPKRIEIKFTTTIPYKIPKSDKNESNKELKFVVTKISDFKLKSKEIVQKIKQHDSKSIEDVKKEHQKSVKNDKFKKSQVKVIDIKKENIVNCKVGIVHKDSEVKHQAPRKINRNVPKKKNDISHKSMNIIRKSEEPVEVCDNNIKVTPVRINTMEAKVEEPIKIIVEN